MDIYVREKRIRLNPASSIGKGGEADIFDIGGGVALKVWKQPNHPDIAGMTEEMNAAALRLTLVQSKMPQFPRGLPDRVVSPIDYARNKSGDMILGYTMRLVAGADTLMHISEPQTRRVFGGNNITRVLCDLWKTVAAVHKAGVVIGDFNDLNVLVHGHTAFVVDADSFQFGGFPCPVFTERFVDPLLCDVDAPRPQLVRSFGVGSDWYAFAVMVMSALLSVGPYGGVYRPKQLSQKVTEAKRPLMRITVFHEDVRYPKPAIPFGVLPDDLLHALSAIFEKDARTPLALADLEHLRFTTCTQCGAEHARARCPACDHGVAREVVVVRGNVKASRKIATSGTIVSASLVAETPAYVLHEEGAYRREDGSALLRSPLDLALRFYIQGNTTFVARSGHVVGIAGGVVKEELHCDTFDREPAFAVNDRYRFYVYGGRLWRRAATSATVLGSGVAEPWGEVLAGQSRIWVGERLGFGFYRASSIAVAFVFDTERRGINDTVRIPWPSGQIVAARAVIDDDRIWFLMTYMSAGRAKNRVVLVGQGGALLGTFDADADDGSWLGAIGGKFAMGGALFTGTAAGVARIELGENGIEERKRFIDTESFVHAASTLLVSRAGLWVVDLREIVSLTMG